MFPGMGKINPKQMQAMLKQLGMKQEEIEAERVIIEKTDGKIIIENPSIQKIVMQGQESFQISGETREETKEKFSEEDIKLIMEKTGKGEHKVRDVLDETGDIAEAIIRLSS